MIDVNKTGLDFARECMGWADARLSIRHDVVILSDSRQMAFDVSDLSSVMAEACEWCVSRDLMFTLTIEKCLNKSGQAASVWKCSVSVGRRLLGLGSSYTCVAEAVMCACVLASRRVTKAA